MYYNKTESIIFYKKQKNLKKSLVNVLYIENSMKLFLLINTIFVEKHIIICSIY